MKIRNKMMLIILPIIAVSIILMNVTFSMFYQYTILSEEDRQIKLTEQNLSSYFSDNQSRYIGRVNDWSHWDDTFYFLENQNPEYAGNIIEQTFIDLDINFIIFLDENDHVKEKFFYDFSQEEFSDFPQYFFRDLNTLLTLPSSNGDASGVIKLGEEYYIVATSEITPFTKNTPNGRMLIGRQIDQALIKSIENNLGSRVVSISTTDKPHSQPVELQDLSYSKNKDSVILSFSISNSINQESSVLITVTKTRDMYMNGLKNTLWFGVFNTVLFLLITVLVFVLMNKYLSKPFIRLFNDMTAIDLNDEEFKKMPEEGKYEFLSLRQTVNRMLDRINAEQERIQYLSYHDQLTNLFNRRYFEENLNQLDTADNLPLSILYADVNGLKFINDAFGHESGDQMIVAFAAVLKETCGEGLLARLGGDEFIVLLPNFDLSSMDKLAGLIQENVDQIKVNNLDLSVSMGWDTKNNNKEPILATIKRAEDIMYKNKLLSINSRSNVVIQTILNTLLIKNPREKGHSQRVGMYCKEIGKAFGLTKDQVNELETAGELHDIGKIILDEAILNKSGGLTEQEWAEVRKHPETGYRLLGNANEFYKISEFVLDHHERWDGTGYPNGLIGEEIHWQARVIMIADAYDAMTSERTYKRAFSEEEAVEEIKKNSGIQFDPVIAKVFVEEVLGYKSQ